MKSPCYILSVLLPLATQLAIATPVADPDFDSLEERGGNDKDYGDHGWGNKNVCEVKRTYPYYKYPCDSSPTNGTSLLGATFSPFCKYQSVSPRPIFLLPLTATDTRTRGFGTPRPRDGSKSPTSLEDVVCET